MMSKISFSNGPLKLSLATPGAVIRLSAGEDDYVIGGHGAVYYDGTPGTEYDFYGTVLRLRPGCLDETMRTSRPVSYFNHDDNYILGCVDAGTMELSLDDVGCQYRTTINKEDPQAISVYAKVNRGDCRGSSMMFMIGDSEYEKQDGRYIEWITRIDPLYEMGPVVNPAMTSADSAALNEESFARYKQLREQREHQDIALARKQRRAREIRIRESSV